jgi:methylmalonyl-CoA/ethylmalonyl-CoA epimerase
VKVLGIRRVTVAVRDLNAARNTYVALLGAQAGSVDAMPTLGVRAAALGLGDSEMRLVAPDGMDNAVMRYIERRGEGFYTLALEVDDVDAAVAELAGRGVRVSAPVETAAGERSAFVAMAATHGLSIELVQFANASREAHAPEPEPDAPPMSDLAHAAEQPASEPAPWPERPRPLDLTPDECSDVD